MGREVTAAEMSAQTKAIRDLSRSMHNFTQVLKDTNRHFEAFNRKFNEQQRISETTEEATDV